MNYYNIMNNNYQLKYYYNYFITNINMLIEFNFINLNFLIFL